MRTHLSVLLTGLIGGLLGGALWTTLDSTAFAQDHVPKVLRAERIEIISPGGDVQLSLIGQALITKNLMLAGGEEPALVLAGPDKTEVSLTTGENRLGLSLRDSTGLRAAVALGAGTGVIALYKDNRLSWVAGKDR